MWQIFKLDLRSLALTRLLLGVLAFFDLARRFQGVPAFYSDGGIMTRADIMQFSELSWRMSLLNLNGSQVFAYILLTIGLVASLFYTIGWRTRISNFIIWIVLISFQARFPEASTSGGDMLFRIFLFWALFLPMGAVYSIDHAVSETRIRSNEYLSVFSAMWIIQIFLLYFFTFLFKWGPVYHTTFDAVWFMLQLDIFTTPFGKWMGEQYFLTKILTAACYALELLGPIILLIPWKKNFFRSVAVLAFWGFHLGIASTLHLGNFVPICLIIWLAVIPSLWWDYLAKKYQVASEKMAILYYDSESVFARQFAYILKEMMMIQGVKILPIQTKDQKFVLLNQQNEHLTGVKLASSLCLSSRILPLRWVGKLLGSDLTMYLNEVKEVGEVGYSVNKYQAPKKSQYSWKILESTFTSIGFDKIKFKLNKFEKFLGSFLLLLVVSWNIEGYVKERDWYIGSPFDEIMFTLHLNQGWAMFAPHPQRSDGWWVMEGKLNSGKPWDALNNKEVSFDKPEDVYATYSTEDWRKFLDNLQSSRDNNYLLSLGKYLCRSWNNTHYGDEMLNSFKLQFMQEWTHGPQGPAPKAEKLTLWNHSCF